MEDKSEEFSWKNEFGEKSKMGPKVETKEFGNLELEQGGFCSPLIARSPGDSHIHFELLN